MAVQFDVTPEALTASARRIMDLKNEFTQQVNIIMQATNDMRETQSFQTGQASVTFYQKMDVYKGIFDDAERTVDRYVEFIESYANHMETSERDLSGEASGLSTGGR